MPKPNKFPAARRGRPTRADVYKRLRVQIGELRARLGGLPSPDEAEGIWRGIWLEEAHHSTAIEGNPLVLKQVEQFEQVHPFLDGNGRVGRLLLNLFLVRLGYPPAIIYKGNRARYLAARLVPLPALATETLSANALRVAAMRGRLKAAKAADGTWRSSTAWVEEYEASRYKRG